MGVDRSVKGSQVSRLPERRRRQQVAAVCYRTRKRGVEFLLVQTRSGRWIFPKGGVEPGLTAAQSAALEAFEEAGVHGRMEEIPFARYFRLRPDAAAPKKGASSVAGRSAQAELPVVVHLCEVSRLESPQESNRRPTWFSVEKAKQRLLQDRAPEFGAELARIVDRAVIRIRRLQGVSGKSPDRRYKDGLQEVRFEALEYGRWQGDLREASLVRHFLRPRDVRPATAIEVAVQAHPGKVQQIGAAGQIRRPLLQLGTGDNITAIDSGRKARSPKPRKVPASKHRSYLRRRP